MAYKLIVAAFNARPFFDRCVASIEAQTHSDFDVVIVDDNSDDGTTEQAFRAVARNGWHGIFQEEHRGALYNQVKAIRSLDCHPDDVLVFVDGDDQLAHPKVLQRLDHYYQGGAKLAYSQYEPVPASPTCTQSAAFPDEIIQKRNFREVAANTGYVYWNHLRTFKYELFAQLTDDDFKDDEGNWYKSAADAALMFPCLELAAPDIAFVPEILYTYTSDNVISDWRKWPNQCDRDHHHILARKPKR